MQGSHRIVLLDELDIETQLDVIYDYLEHNGYDLDKVAARYSVTSDPELSRAWLARFALMDVAVGYEHVMNVPDRFRPDPGPRGKPRSRSGTATSADSFANAPKDSK